MLSYTYLWINFFTIILCFIFSFHSKIRFNQQFSSFLKAATLSATPFIVWDIYFTLKGVWWFNPTYLTGITFLYLPLEEWLFFWCIPFSCVFTYYVLARHLNLSWANAFSTIIVFVLLIVASVVLLLHYTQIYTLFAFASMLLTLIYLYFFAKVQWIGEVTLVYILLFPGFLIVNGILAGSGLATPIVNYNPTQNLNLRLFTIPVEDVVYGYTLIVLNIYLFKKFQQQSK